MTGIYWSAARISAIAMMVSVPAGAWAQDYESVAPKQLPAQRPPEPPADPVVPQSAPMNGASMVVPVLKGIVFVPNRDMVQPQGVALDGIVTTGLAPIDTPAFTASAKAYLGKPVTMTGLQEITDLVTAAYRAAGRPAVRAVVPQQNVESGTIQVVVMEFRVGKIEVEGNKHFTDSQVAAPFAVRQGDVIDTREIADALDAANANPFRRVELVYKPGAEPGYADLVLQTQDRLPFRPYVTYDNGGPVPIGRDRLGIGFSWGNAFGADHLLAYQFTASADIFGGGNRSDSRNVTSFTSHSGYWSIPAFGDDRVILFGAYERSKPDVGANFGLVGKSGQISLRYQHRLPTSSALQHKLEFGLDFKSTNNNLDFGGTRVSRQQTHIAQLLLSWNGSIPDRGGVTSFGSTLVWSPGGLTRHNEDDDFQPSLTHAGRDGAKADYLYLRATMERLTLLPGGASLNMKLMGQISNRPLLETEQLTLGGRDTLRGYEPNSVNGDQGVFLSTELRSPSINIGPETRMHGLMFVDTAMLWNKFDVPGQDESFSAASVGTGLRFNFGTNLIASADFGWQLKRLPNQRNLGQLGMLSLTLAY